MIHHKKEETLLRVYRVRKHNGMFLDKEGQILTDPYGCLQYSIGDGYDFVCFDFAIIPHPKYKSRRLVVLDAVVNCESASFIDSFSEDIVELGDLSSDEISRAANAAAEMCHSAIEWCESADIKRIRYCKADAMHFARALAFALSQQNPEYDNQNLGLTRRMIRLGSKATLKRWGI